MPILILIFFAAFFVCFCFYNAFMYFLYAMEAESKFHRQQYALVAAFCTTAGMTLMIIMALGIMDS